MPISVHDYLGDVAKYPAKPVCVVFGDDAFLRLHAVRQIRDQVLSAEDAEFSQTQFEGDDITFKDLLRELQTVAMFGGGRRVVRVNDAEKFVSAYRAELEKYVAQPSNQAVLIVQVKTFPATTKLYKQLAATGLLIDANACSEKEMPKWVAGWSKKYHKTPCEHAAAEMIVQRIGMEHGLLDQELAKLALMVADAKIGITLELVEQAVGSWRSRTVWDMLDLALEGKTAAAIRQLDALILAGEEPKRILGAFAKKLGPFIAATELILAAERQGSKLLVRTAMEMASGKDYYLGKREQQLRHLGRYRGAMLPKWLLQLDLDLTGESRSNPRLLLETFIIKISSDKDKLHPAQNM